MKYTQDYLEQINKLKTTLKNADAILIGAGAGLSTSAGFEYSGNRFKDNFSDFEEKYGFHDMYSGGFYPYSSLEEYWAYWSRYVFINRYTQPPKPVYDDLFRLVEDKNYFVITTNVDHCFQKAGFDKQRLFYTQGDYGLFQCSVPCHSQTYDNEEIIRRMVKEQKDMKVPSQLIPRCPLCGMPMTMNLRADDKFAQDEGWDIACKRYENFLKRNRDSKVLYLELGVGNNTPVIIKYPFWRLTAQNPNAAYACVNYGEAICPPQIQSQSVCINEDIGEVLKDLGKK
ncbi:MAG: Sir2 silent information regulator family NAD-dependent deacetylase [Clostridia bacterium]|nr:Sir2 silent information regulator family NAD-dependent deacetylase [Clostridia bacterium]MDE6605371.1 Sir2 silent information regulator family NAD-dependent deacetylase [Clostridia bacterium]